MTSERRIAHSPHAHASSHSYPLRPEGGTGWEDLEALASLTSPYKAILHETGGWDMEARYYRESLMTRLSITSSGHRLSPPSCDISVRLLIGLKWLWGGGIRSVYIRVSHISFGSPLVTQSLPDILPLTSLSSVVASLHHLYLASLGSRNEWKKWCETTERETRHSSLFLTVSLRVAGLSVNHITHLLQGSLLRVSALFTRSWWMMLT